jgi:hypothetical protein
MSKTSQFKAESLPNQENLTTEKLRALEDNVSALESLMFLVETDPEGAKNALAGKAKKD